MFNNVKYQESLFLIPYSIIVTIIVYVSCTLIELLRQRAIERPFMVFFNRYSDKVSELIDKCLDCVKKFSFGIQK